MLIYFHEECRARSITRRFGRIRWQFDTLVKTTDDDGKQAERWQPCDGPPMTTAELEEYLLTGSTDLDAKDFSRIQTVGLRAR